MGSVSHILVLFLISFLSWGVHARSCTPRTPSMRQRYRQWMAEQNKIYTNSIEREERFEIFKKNAKYIDEFNAAGNKSYTLGLNQFSDLTNEERVARFSGARPPRTLKPSPTYKRQNVRVGNYPKSWDWRRLGAVTPPKTQTCGDCWLFAGVAEVESINFLAKGGELQTLSTQEIMDCDNLPGKGGCKGGWVQEVYEYVKHYGLTTEANYPKQAVNGTCDISKKEKSRNARVSSFVTMRPSTDEELMAEVIKHPIVISIDTRSPAFGGYKSGVFTGPCNSDLNHLMQLVGYGETPEGMKYWIVRNSWSSGWGEEGYIRIQRGSGRKEGVCGINLWPSYPNYY